MGRETRPLKIGLYSPFFGSTIGGGEKYFGVTAEALRDGFPDHHVEIVSPVPVDVERYERMLDLDFHDISFRAGDVRAAGLGRRVRRLPVLRRYADLYLASKAVDWTRQYDLFISMVYVMPAFSKARRGVILCQFPYTMSKEWAVKPGVPPLLYKAYTAPYHLLKKRWLGNEADSFDLVICQSEYVRKWVGRYWERDSLIVNPPIDVPAEEPDLDAKEPVILSVGRFFASGHSKRHDLMAEAFRQLCDAGLEGWELHLAGSLHRSNPDDMRYFEKVQALAQGYPVHIHADVPLDELKDLYRRASIYWHAAGIGVDEERRPIDIEHFGMSTVEAMGFGDVPVAIGKGGQVEVVDDGETGYLWTDLEQLKARTTELVDAPDLRRRMGARARAASFRFSRAEFKRKMVDDMAPLIRELERETRAGVAD